jgi:hypothetical protein
MSLDTLARKTASSFAEIRQNVVTVFHRIQQPDTSDKCCALNELVSEMQINNILHIAASYFQ